MSVGLCGGAGGCTGCHPDIRQIIADIRGEKAPAGQPVPPQPTAQLQRPTLTNIRKIQLIQQTLDQQVRPPLQADGGDLELIDVVDNRVIVAFRGMCAKCLAAGVTVADLVQAKLHEFVSEDLVVEEQKS